MLPILTKSGFHFAESSIAYMKTVQGTSCMRYRCLTCARKPSGVDMPLGGLSAHIHRYSVTRISVEYKAELSLEANEIRLAR